MKDSSHALLFSVFCSRAVASRSTLTEKNIRLMDSLMRYRKKARTFVMSFHWATLSECYSD